MTPEPLDRAIPAETVCEHAGVDTGLRGIASRFYDAFSHGADQSVATAFYGGTLDWREAARGHRLLGAHLTPTVAT